MIVYLERRNTEVAGLSHPSQKVVVAGEGSLLVAATLAASLWASAGTINCDDLSIGVEFLDHHLVLMTRGTAEATHAGRIFKRMKYLVLANEVLELRLGLTAQNLL